jgi:hypothetical protein
MDEAPPERGIGDPPDARRSEGRQAQVIPINRAA